MRYLQARNYTPSKREDVRAVVIHTAECQERAGSAWAVAHYFAGTTAPAASAHYTVDADEVVQSVAERDVAWHANDANGWSIGIEHAGTAAQKPEQWADPFSVAMLERSAELVAGICKRWGIPPRWLSPDELREGARGICGHVDVNAAFRGGKGHWDPGPHFPRDWYVERVASHLRRLEDDTPPTLPAGGRLGGGMLAIDGIVDGLNETRGKE
jgi:N-acetyl-anhydromuramyl-L-alanine amidase AmpD